MTRNPFWREAQLDVFPRVGDAITRHDTFHMMGMRVDETVQMFYKKSPWDLGSREWSIARTGVVAGAQFAVAATGGNRVRMIDWTS